MTIGLHHRMPHYINIDHMTRQHRIRIWWAIYNCDRIWGSKLGHPASIQDGTTSVELPSMTGLNEQEQANFSDPEYAIANIKLARIVGNVIAKIYGRNQTEPFVQSVRAILRDLKDWMTNLPESIKLPRASTSAPRNIIALHLSLNQVSTSATCWEQVHLT